MALPWLQILDAVIGVTDLARSRKIRKMSQESADPQQQLEAGRAAAGFGGLEARLAGVVVAALKEAFERDTHRLGTVDGDFQRSENAGPVVGGVAGDHDPVAAWRRRRVGGDLQSFPQSGVIF